MQPVRELWGKRLLVGQSPANRVAAARQRLVQASNMTYAVLSLLISGYFVIFYDLFKSKNCPISDPGGLGAAGEGRA